MIPHLETTYRHADYTLEDHHEMLIEAFGSYFAQHCSPERVRESAPTGFDAKLWKAFQDLRPVAMGLPESLGGDGAGLVELLLVAEQFGRHIPPIPLIEATVGARLAAAAGADAGLLEGVLDGDRIVTVALHASTPGRSQLVPAGAVAGAVVGLHGDDLVLVSLDEQPEHVPNTAGAPLGRVDLGAAKPQVLATGAAARDAWRQARREWQLLTAGAMTGMARQATEVAVEYAKSRIAFGVPIGSFQAVAHPLVDNAIATESSQRIARKAAWWADFEPSAGRQLIPMAFLSAVETAETSTRVGIHTLGGVGFTVESELELYFRRAKGWALVGGDPQGQLDDIADELYGAQNEEAQS